MNTGQASLESVLTPSFPEWGERAGEREEGDGERERRCGLHATPVVTPEQTRPGGPT